MAAESLEQRIAALETGATYDSTQKAIREREEEMLTTLRNIREQMANEAGSGASSAEVNDLKTENEKLKTTVTKQEFRIRHLITSMEELLEAKKTA